MTSSTDKAMTFTTAEYSVSRSRLLRSAAALCHARELYTSLGLLLVIDVALGFLIDWRFALVTAMLALVLAPGALAFLFFNYALSPRCLPEVWPHTVTFGPDGFEVRATVPPLPQTEDSDGTNPEEEMKASPTHIGYAARIRRCTRGSCRRGWTGDTSCRNSPRPAACAIRRAARIQGKYSIHP